MPAKIDVTGQRFGRLKVLSDADKAPTRRRRVLCVCDCGKEKIVDPRMLRRGHTTSCGCAQREAVSKAASASKRYEVPVNKMPEYSTWLGMKKRCFNRNEPKYPIYGGRGISVCDRWLNDFGAFLFDMGKKPSLNHSIDRIDVNGNYYPENCRWATAKEQSLNKRNHILVEYDGKQLPLSEACRQAGVNYRSAVYRHKNGHNWQQIALPEPPGQSEGGEKP